MFEPTHNAGGIRKKRSGSAQGEHGDWATEVGRVQKGLHSRQKMLCLTMHGRRIRWGVRTGARGLEAQNDGQWKILGGRGPGTGGSLFSFFLSIHIQHFQAHFMQFRPINHA